MAKFKTEETKMTDINFCKRKIEKAKRIITKNQKDLKYYEEKLKINTEKNRCLNRDKYKLKKGTQNENTN